MPAAAPITEDNVRVDRKICPELFYFPSTYPPSTGRQMPVTILA